MNTFSSPLRNSLCDENGFVLVTSLLLLVVLSLIGISSMRSTTFEVQISGNDRVTKLNFYQAESAARAGAQRLYDRDPAVNKDLLLPKYNTLASDPDGLLHEADAKQPFDDVKNIDADNDNAITMADLSNAGDSFDVFGTQDRRAKVVMLESGINTSLKMGGSRLYSYGSYGASNIQKGFSMVFIGFKKRF